MIPYRPKLNFHKDSKQREAWQQLATNPLLHKAIEATQAEMAQTGMFGPQEMNGVSNFIIMLLNLSEDEGEIKQLPIRRLTSFEMPMPQMPTMPEGEK